MSSIASESDPLGLIGSKKAWLVCFSAAMFFFYEFIQMHMFNAISEPLREAFDANATQFGLLSSTYLLGDLLFLLPAGILLDRYSTRKITLIAMVVCIIGTLGFALSTNFWWAAFFHLLSGIGNAFCFLSCIILVSRWFPANRQAMLVGLVITLAFLGGMLAQTPLAYLASQVGWRQSLLWDAALGVLIMGVIYSQVEDSPNGQWRVIKQSRAQFISDLMQVFKNKQNWLPGVYTCLLNLPVMVLCAVWGNTYLQTAHGLSSMAATQVTSMIFVGSIIGCPLAGRLSDSIGSRRKPMIAGGVLTFAVMTGLMMIEHWSYSALLEMFFLIGFFSSSQVIAYPMVAESNPLELTGTATGLASLIIMGGAGGAQIVFGELLDWHWSGAMHGVTRAYTAADFHFAMGLFPVACLLALLAVSFSRETLQSERKKEFNHVCE